MRGAILLMRCLKRVYARLSATVTVADPNNPLANCKRTASEHRVEATRWAGSRVGARWPPQQVAHPGPLRRRTQYRYLFRTTCSLAARRRSVDFRVDILSVFLQPAPSGGGACTLRAVVSAPVLSECGARESQWRRWSPPVDHSGDSRVRL